MEETQNSKSLQNVNVELHGRAEGLLLPAGILQPFDMHFAADELHVIAYFQGHLEYEAVEAMIRRRGATTTTVRAILTRHDQTQVDHVNDITRRLEAQAFNGRQTVYRDVSVVEGGTPQQPWVTVRFMSFSNEAIELRIVTASPPDVARGGLTDPGGHSPESSLPLMWRGKSCLAGPGTSVVIDDRVYAVREKFRSPSGFVGLNGFYSETHLMGAIRASTRSYRVLHEPAQISLGSYWEFAERDGRVSRYEVTGTSDSKSIVVESNAELHSERIWAKVIGDRLRLFKVERLGPDQHENGFAIRLFAGGRFELDVANNNSLVSGFARTSERSPVAAAFELSPQEPVWAVGRQVCVQTSRVGDNVKLQTYVGQSALP